MADLSKAIAGKEVIIEPNSPSKGVTVAFILENGAPVELIEFSEKQGMPKKELNIACPVPISVGGLT